MFKLCLGGGYIIYTTGCDSRREFDIDLSYTVCSEIVEDKRDTLRDCDTYGRHPIRKYQTNKNF